MAEQKDLRRDVATRSPDRTDTGSNPEAPVSADTSSDSGPLASLYRNKYEYKMLQYPMNIEAAEENHWVRFDIVELKGTSVKQEKTRRPLFTGSTGGDGGFLDNIISGTAEKVTALATSAIMAPINAVNATVNEFVNDLPPFLQGVGRDLLGGGSERSRGLGSVMLYAPHTRQDVYKLQWNQATDVGQAGAALMSGGGTATGAAMSVIEGNNETVESLKNQGPQVASGLLSQVGGTSLGSAQGRNITNRAAGKAVNPHLEMFFQSVDFRTFTFDFKMSPRSRKEAKNINKIVQLLKYASAPALLDGEYGWYFAYPNVFDITMFNESKTHKIARSALTGIQVDHSGAGVNSTFYDDYPVETNLNVQFTELEIITKGKIDQGY